MCNKAFEKHLAAIRAGIVDKSNIAGIRKALNTHEREARGYSIGQKAANCTAAQRDELFALLWRRAPTVTGALAETGKAMLQSKRYAKQLASVADIIEDVVSFSLVGFDMQGTHGMYAVPVYRARDSGGHSFPFYVLPWQSGGSGPQLASGNYY